MNIPKNVFSLILSIAALALVAFSGYAQGETTQKSSSSMKKVSAVGPGILHKTFKPEELYKSLGVINSSKHGSRGHAAMQMFNGYLMSLEARDSGLGDAAIAFFDISDPKNPKRVATHHDQNTQVLFEGHNYGFMTAEGRDIVFLNAQKGLQIWDWTDIQSPKMLSSVDIPNLTKGAYANTIWWLAVQYPYIYMGGTNTGIHIVDASNLSNPKVAKSIPMNKLGGFKVGSLFACGNLLVCSTFDGPGISTLDISDPLDPKLLKTVKKSFGYSILFNGGYIYGIGEKPTIWDARTPGKLDFISNYKGEKLGSKGGYAVYQDGFLHQGASNGYAKVDVSDPKNPKLVRRLPMSVPKQDFDGANVIGNYVIMACDHGTGSHIIAHTSEPDTKGPVVNYVNPIDQSKNIHRLSRIGLTFSDEIDHHNLSNLIVQPVGGSPIDGHWSLHNSILNFTPSQPLVNATTYEIIIPKGSILDQVGNPIDQPFRSTFSTGENLSDFKVSISQTSPKEIDNLIHFTVESDDQSLNENIQYSWDFGDGSEATNFSTKLTTSHQYTQSGRYTVILHAKKGKQTAAAQASQLLYKPLTSQKAKHSKTIVLSEDKNTLWCVNSDNNSLSVIDTVKGEKVTEIKVPTNPRTISLSSKLAVLTSQEEPTLTIIDVQSKGIKHSVSLPKGSQPYGVIIDHQGINAYVSSQASGNIFVIDCINGTHLKTIKSNSMTNLRGLALDATGETLYATRFISKDEYAEIYAITLKDSSVKIIPLQIDTTPDTEESGRGLPNYLSSISISPDGTSAWIPSKKDNIQRGKSRDGKALTFESTVRPIASKINLTTKKEVYSVRHDFNDKEGPFNAIYSPYGDLLFVTMLGNNSVEIINSYTGDHITSILNVGAAPQGLVIDPDSNKLYVHSFLDRKISIFNVDEIIREGGGYSKKIGEINTINKEKLDHFTLKGKKLFYDASNPKMSRDSYISCASCHLDGDQDGRVWDFTNRGEGLRNTISLLGKSAEGHGLLHWSANFDEIQDFEHDVRDEFGGSGFINSTLQETKFFAQNHHPLGFPKAGISEDLDALAAYLRSLSKTPESPHRKEGALTDQAITGKELFTQLNCASCHSGSEFTDSSKHILHDVGTLNKLSGKRLGSNLKGIDTPSLKGLWATAPYLHDGSAKSLREVFTDKNKQDKHGATSKLKEDELQSLIAFLLQIDDSEPAIQPVSTNSYISSTPVITYNDLAMSIINAINSKVPSTPITTIRKSPISIEEAYQIQVIYDQYMEKLYGSPIGHKMAYASKASQEKWGIPAPVSGTFFKEQQVQSGGSVKANTFLGFHIESEIAFTLKKDISQPIKKISDLNKYIATVHVGLDVPDLRYDKSKGKVQVADVIAMSCGTHTYVIGKGVPLKSIDFEKIKVALTRDGEEVYSGAASNVMGDPRESLRQLANRMLKSGKPLKKGQVVLTGSVAGAYFPKEKVNQLGKYVGTATGLPSVLLTVE